MKVLLTGANGFIGSQVCHALLQRGHQVVALFHRSRERLEALPGSAGLRFEAGDILDPAGLQQICAAHCPDGVCHLAIQPPPEREALMARQVNVQGTLNLLQVCQEQGIARLVYTSSMSVYNFQAPAYLPVDEDHPVEPLQAYGAEKRQAEVYCEEYATHHHMHIPVLRLAGVYGPGKRQGVVYHFIRAVLLQKEVIIPLNRRIDLVYVQDAAQVVVRALEGAGRIGWGIFNIGAGSSVALDELAGLVGQETGLQARIDCQDQGNEFYLDISRAREALDYQPLALREGVARFIRWIQEDEG